MAIFRNMTERVIDRSLKLRVDKPQVAALPESAVHDSLRERGFHFLEPQTTVLLHAEVTSSASAHIFHMEPVELEEGVEVVLARKPIIHPGLPIAMKPLVLVPVSENRRSAERARELAGRHWDVDAVLASSDAIRREDARLAWGLLSGRVKIDPSTLTRVYITAAKAS